ncbi:hypothetical protein FOZ61_006784 [Perkinsus olseni]|uniref:Cysteine protease n=1 Tax=Perkinsus olseni TaxID=32597 RepID=A0A7J6LBH1_PEROL|nr:hypothetical protein FOZ61_006784 [Perkinsus olseni]KAF4660041.1 hypothetical protein FOL46_006350 [Perkinsus olseni]
MAAYLLVLLSFIPLYDFIDQDIASLAFVGFQTKYGKRYRDEEEESKRSRIFQDNLKLIEEVNSQDLPYKLGVNEYANLTSEEFSAQKLRPLKVDKKMKGTMLVQAEDDAVDLPDVVEWRPKGVLNPVKDQGNGCDGGLMEYAYEYIHDYGIDLDSTYPYNAKDNKCLDTLVKNADGLSVGEVNGYYRLDSTDAALMTALVAAPVSTAMFADDDLRFYSSGVYTSYVCQVIGDIINHGIVAVGYGTEEGKDYYLMRNSWGPSWGLDGYFKIKRGGDGDYGECNVLEYMCVATLKAN